jgi:hypothetical protein
MAMWIWQLIESGPAAKKAQGVKLGKPKGTLQPSQYDTDVKKIIELLDLGLSARKIVGHLGYGHHNTLNTYVNKRQLRDPRARQAFLEELSARQPAASL